VSVRGAMRIQNVFTVAKLVALSIVILLGFWQLLTGFPIIINDRTYKSNLFKNKGEAENLNFDPIHPDGSFDVGGLSLAFYSGLFAYGGWNYLNFVIDELQDPYRFVTSTRSIHL